MSWNIHADIQTEASDGERVGIILARASRGITTSASVAVGDKITFDGLSCRVVEIMHEHAAPNSPHAPNSHVIVKFSKRVMSDDDVTTLQRHGFITDVPR